MSSTLIMCPNCGQVIDLSDPRLATLTPETLQAWHTLQDRVRPGQRFGSTEIADHISLSVSQAYWHIRQMVNAGLLDEEPKRAGGTYRVYLLRD